MHAEIMNLLKALASVRLQGVADQTIFEMREMWLLLLQMKDMRVSQASRLRMRIPVKRGAFFLKLASDSDHCSYIVPKSYFRLKYRLMRASVSSSL